MDDIVFHQPANNFWTPVELLNLTFERELAGALDAKVLLPREACISLFLLLHLLAPRKGGDIQRGGMSHA